MQQEENVTTQNCTGFMQSCSTRSSKGLITAYGVQLPTQETRNVG